MDNYFTDLRLSNRTDVNDVLNSEIVGRSTMVKTKPLGGNGLAIRGNVRSREIKYRYRRKRRIKVSHEQSLPKTIFRVGLWTCKQILFLLKFFNLCDTLAFCIKPKFKHSERFLYFLNHGAVDMMKFINHSSISNVSTLTKWLLCADVTRGIKSKYKTNGSN